MVSHDEKIPLIIADWRTGAFTQRDLARKHKVSLGFVNKHTKPFERDAAATVNKLVEAKQELSQFDVNTVNSVHAVVEERSNHIKFFNNAALRNVNAAVRKINEGTSQAEHRMLADTILKGRETVLGKVPDTAIQVNNINKGNAPPPVENLPIDPMRLAELYQKIVVGS